MHNSSKSGEKETFYLLNPGIANDEWKKRTGKGVSVAVIDSGIDAQHPELRGKIAESVEAQADHRRILFVPSASGDSAGHHQFDCTGLRTLQYKSSGRTGIGRRAGFSGRIGICDKKKNPIDKFKPRNDKAAIFRAFA
jgi:hypothetical protein